MLVSKAALSRANLVGLLACLADDGGELGLVLCYVRKQKKIKPRAGEGRGIVLSSKRAMAKRSLRVAARLMDSDNSGRSVDQPQG